MTKRSATKKPKLTKWFDGSKFVPFHVGEYNASMFFDSDLLRWWDGESWSVAYYKTEPECKKCEFRIMKSQSIHINFRGLAVKP